MEAPVIAKPALIVKEATPEDDLEYADAAGKSCYLCSRQFKTTDQLKRHNKESDLHKARTMSTASEFLANIFLFIFLSSLSFIVFSLSLYHRRTWEMKLYVRQLCKRQQRSSNQSIVTAPPNAVCSLISPTFHYLKASHRSASPRSLWPQPLCLHHRQSTSTQAKTAAMWETSC